MAFPDSQTDTTNARAFEQAMLNSVDSDGASGAACRAGRASKLRVWGNGIVEQSLTTLRYPCDWASVCDDELVFFLPSLTQHSVPSQSRPWLGGNAGPSRCGVHCQQGYSGW
jgi:hypothetical protein